MTVDHNLHVLQADIADAVLSFETPLVKRTPAQKALILARLKAQLASLDREQEQANGNA